METLSLRVLSFQPTLSEDSIVSGSVSLPPPPGTTRPLHSRRYQQTPSVTLAQKPLASNLTTAVKATARACLTNLLLRVLCKQRHIFTHCQNNTHTHTLEETIPHRILPSLCQDQKKKKKTFLVNLLLSCFLYPSLYVIGCWIYTDRIRLMSSMFLGLTVFI